MGQEAKKRISEAGLGIHGNIIRSPKAHLGQESLHVEGLELHPIDVVADVAKHIIQQTQENSRFKGLEKISSAVVTIPVNMDGERRRALRDAFKQADIQILQFVHEPLAALYGFYRNQELSKSLRRYHKKLVLVFDWGGGTLDLTLCLPTSTMVVQIINDGTDEVGGFSVDSFFEIHVFSCLLFLISSGLILFFVVHRRVFFLLLFGLIFLLPTFIVPLNVLVNEHRLYMSLVAVSFLIAQLYTKTLKYRNLYV